MSDWVELLVTGDDLESEIVRNILEAEGIEVVVDSLKVRPYPVSIGKMGQIKLLVKKNHEKEARRIIEIMKNSPGE